MQKRVPLDEKGLFYLTALEDGRYSIDVEKANDSHYNLSREGLETLAAHLKGRYGTEDAASGLAAFLRENGEPQLTALLDELGISYRQFHFDDYDDFPG